MTKLLNTTTTNSISLNATLHGVINAAVAFVRGLLPSLNGNDGAQLSNRLRYDIGLLDLNPDCQPRSAAACQNMDQFRSI